MILWERDKTQAVCKIGVAGDFLPSGGLVLPEGVTWVEMSQNLGELFNDLDIAFVNLECPVDVHPAKPRIKMGLGDSFAAPAEALDFLPPLRATVVGLANNHIYDYGQQGLERTRQALFSKGITSLGVGKSLDESPDIHVWKSPVGIEVGFWAAARGLPELSTRRRSGIEAATTKRAAEALSEMKKRGAHLCIALLHTGLEHTNHPDPGDVLLMDSFACIGFDIVTAAHSHRISGYKLLPAFGGRLACCFYGLGSLVSGVIYSSLEREGILVVVSLDRQGALLRIEARPVYLAGSGWGMSAYSPHHESIMDRFRSCSREIVDGSYKTVFYRDTGKDLFGRQLRDVQVAFQKGGVKGIAQKLGRLRMRHMQRLIRKFGH